MAEQRALRVVEPGAQSTVQDGGRPGLGHLGVPRSGWLDGPSARLANRLVGNPEDAAVVECLMGGLVVAATAAMTGAVTGAECEIRAGGRAVGSGSAFAVLGGDRVTLGPVSRGARCYLAVAGGVAVDPVLGSRATDTLSGVGPEQLRAGAVLPVGPPLSQPGEGQQLRVWDAGPATLRCWPGPRTDWFTDTALTTLATATYTVHPDSDRVGLRLSGPALERRVGAELPSEGLVLGALQVPADGRPVVFLNDHPTTGGYPVPAVVDPRDLARCAQLRPGDAVRFALRRAPFAPG